MTTSRAERSAPGRKPRLTRAEIVDAAIHLLNEEGVGALTLRRLGADLGMAVMSLYRYFDSREELEDAILARVMPMPPQEDPNPPLPWYEQLREYMIAHHDAFVTCPGAADLIARRSGSTPAMDRVRDYTLTIMSGGGMSDDDVVQASGAVGRYILGCALASSSSRAPADEGVRMQNLSDDYPVLRRYAMKYADHTGMETTRYGLDLFIRGLRDLLAEKGHAE